MWSLHDDDLTGDDLVGDEFDPEWELEALLDVHADRIDTAAMRRVVADLDAAHDLLAVGDPAGVERLRAVLGVIDELVSQGRLTSEAVDEVVSLAQAALDMAEADGMERLPYHHE